MSERQPKDIKGDERQDFDDKSSLDTVRDSRTLGKRALEVRCVSSDRKQLRRLPYGQLKATQSKDLPSNKHHKPLLLRQTKLLHLIEGERSCHRH